MEKLLQILIALFFIVIVGNYIRMYYKAENCYVNKIDTQECREAIFASRGALK